MKKIFSIIFFLIVCVDASHAKNFFMVGGTKIFYESPQGCVNANIFARELNDYFKTQDKINDIHVTYVSDETSEQWLKEIATKKKYSSNIKTLSIGNDKEHTDDISSPLFENIIKNQSRGLKNNTFSNIEYIKERIGKKHATWMIILKYSSSYTISAVSYVFIKNKLITINTRATYTDEIYRQEQIAWAEKHSLHAITMLLELND